MSIIATGTEIVETVRIAKMIETHGEQFLERVYTADEIEYCVQTADAPGHFATRWAAKEAVMKALRCRRRGVRWNEIEIVVRPGSGYDVVLSGNALQCASEHEIDRLHLSLSACRTHAVAHVIAEAE
ncbi:holo-ACP synthase [Roseiconus lacunae]|uniref:Holo-[acyl-carrier-protein] synthase n=1 Tax=Roseiconus lacunae TaxID=2605694 RepID=A0ABT7PQY7_9BACT|nr:holo-ACP synthase [Roseiconus lacunae]MCD0460322.1 holo-ACP synthase [Roseiconus lacunae]MDM4018924.1 holo-ACP synthase [Roseiconus lacunae]WRQ51851.1 holo-ACP synthase [Stieleria sp. HD01]